MIKPGEVWTTRVFRDPDPQLRVFKVVTFRDMGVGVVDMEDPRNAARIKGREPEVVERVIWFEKSDLQFFDRLQAPAGANEEGN